MNTRLHYTLTLVAGLLMTGFGYSQTILMQNGGSTGCSGTFYDSGGSGGGYGTNEDFTYTFTGQGGYPQLVFSSFNLGSTFWNHEIEFFDGPTTASPSLGAFGGTNNPGTITASGLYLTVTFTSDGFGGGFGWQAALSCFIPPLTAVISDTLFLDCYGDTVDSVGPVVVGGGAPYTYLWSTGSVDSMETNLGPGAYSVTVTDTTGTTDTAAFFIFEPDSLALDATVTNQLVCDYDISSVLATGSGGTPLGEYVWDTTSSFFSFDTSMTGTEVLLGDDQTSLPLDLGFDFIFFGDTFDQFRINSNGYISFDVANGNSYFESQMPNPFAPNAIVAAVWEDLDPDNGNDGTVTYYSTGVAPNRVMHINFIDVAYFGGTFGDVTFQIKLYETTNCVEIHTARAGYSGAATQQVQGIEDLTGTRFFTHPERNWTLWSTDSSYIAFCPTDTNGLAYEWSNGSLSQIQAGLNPGNYTVTLSDANGCVKVDSVTINEPQSALVSDPVATDVTCFGASDGTVDPGVTGGVMPMTYMWNNSESTATIADLGPGLYSVFAEDNVGCTIEVNNVVVWEPEILVSVVNSVENVNCPGDTTGSASGVAAGGIAPYIYTWSPVNQGGQMASGLSDGTYNLMVTDSNGCESFATVTVLAENDLPVLDLGPDLFSSEGESFLIGPGGGYTSYTWSTSATTDIIEVTESGIYSVTVTNDAGCEASDEIEVEIWALGVNDITDAKVKVYPNPASSSVNLEVLVGNNASVQVYDTKGRMVMQNNTLGAGVNTLNVSDLNSGMYMLNVELDGVVTRHQLSIVR